MGNHCFGHGRSYYTPYNGGYDSRCCRPYPVYSRYVVPARIYHRGYYGPEPVCYPRGYYGGGQRCIR